MFNHWKPNLSWKALNLSTSVGSSRKIKSAISLSKIGSILQKFRKRHFLTSTAEAKKAGKASSVIFSESTYRRKKSQALKRLANV